MTTDKRSSVKGKRCLVTGAGGFIGSHLTRQLVEAGAETFALVSEVSSVVPIRLGDLKHDVTIVAGNVSDSSAMRRVAVTVRPEVVFHLAAFTHVGKSFGRVDECIDTNVHGTVNVLTSLEPGSYETFIYAGTSEIYGDIEVPFEETKAVNPISPYSMTKYAGERFCLMYNQAYGWPVVCLRPFNAFGPWQSPDRVIPEIITSAIRGRDVAMTEGIQTREFNFVADIARGFICAAEAGEAAHGQIINIGCGKERSMAEVATTVLRLMGDPVKALLGAMPYRPTEIWHMYADSRKAADLLGWHPNIDFEEALDATIEWYRTQAANPNSLFIP